MYCVAVFMSALQNQTSTLSLSDSLVGKTVVVTAGGSGIGLAIVTALAAAGADLVVGDTDCSRLRDIEGSITAVEADLHRADSAPRLVDEARRRHDGVDALVACLGGPIEPGRSFMERDDADWQLSFEHNLLGAVRATRAVVPAIGDGGGSLVFIGSGIGREPNPNFVSYAALKAALLNLSKSLSMELAPKIRSNVVSPGPTRTPGLVADLTAMSGATDEAGVDAALADYVKGHRMAMERLVEPEEIAAGVLFLLSDAASALTGSELVIDCGTRRAV